MGKREQRVVRAAMRWYRLGQGFLYRNGKVTSEDAARKLEDAIAALAKPRKATRRKHG